MGVAGCDGMGLFARELTTIARSTFARDLDQLRDLIASRQVEVLVVGLPYALDGSSSKQTEIVRTYGDRLGAALNLPVEFVDERLTSVEAEAQLKAEDRNFSPRRDKARIDARAAAIILQQWLDCRPRSPSAT